MCNLSILALSKGNFHSRLDMEVGFPIADDTSGSTLFSKSLDVPAGNVIVTTFGVSAILPNVSVSW